MQDFRHLAEHYALVSLYETEPYGSRGRSVVVDKLSALTYLPHEEPLGIPASHTDMCRFASADDPWFRAVVKRIERAALGRVGLSASGMPGGPGWVFAAAGAGGTAVDELVGAPGAFAVAAGKASQVRVTELRTITDGSETTLAAAAFYDHLRNTDEKKVLAFQNVKAVG